MNQSLWKQSLTKQWSPPWPCPTCRKGTFALLPTSLVHRETVSSKRAHHEEGWNFEWITYVFTAWIKCNNPACGEEAVITGVGGVDQCYDQDGETDYYDFFAPRFCTPMPDIFELPKKCPDDVAFELRAAFGLFWSDPSAAANCVRVALERLMDHLKIQKRRKNKKGKFYKLTLDERIKIYMKADPIIGGQLMALKLFGNTGSHDRSVKRGDVLDAFEIIEHALCELVEHKSKRVAALAQGLVKKHRPGGRQRKPLF